MSLFHLMYPISTLSNGAVGPIGWTSASTLKLRLGLFFSLISVST